MDVASASVPIIVAKIAPASITPSISIAPRLAVKQENDHHLPGPIGIGIHTTKEWIVPPRPKVCSMNLSFLLLKHDSNHSFLAGTKTCDGHSSHCKYKDPRILDNLFPVNIGAII